MRSVLVAAVALLIAAPVAGAATISVTTTGDTNANDGLCSLREAVRAANTDAATLGCPGGGGPDTIAVPAGTFPLSVAGSDQVAAVGDLDITGTVTVQGQGAGATVVNANGINRVFEVRPNVPGVRIERMTVTGGLPNDDDNGDGCRGGGILSQGALTVADSTVSGNRTGAACTANAGGGIAAAAGTLAVVDSVVSSNATADGVAQAGSSCGTSCTGTAGEGAGAGGGAWSAGGVTVTRSVFSGNRAGNGGNGGAATGGPGLANGGTGGTGTGGTGGEGGDGGAIASAAGAVVIDDSTLVGNRAGAGGTGGVGNGGLGGGGGNNINGGTGGTGNGGSGGTGGDGGAVQAKGTLSVTRSTLSGNVAGTSGNGGAAAGGQGGPPGTGVSTSGGGGSGQGGIGGTSGQGGAIWAVQLTATNATVDGNVSGGGGNGGAGAGGPSAFGGPGAGRGGDGRSPGQAGGLSLQGAASNDQLVHVTLSDNGVGSFGVGGTGTGGGGSANGANASLVRPSTLYTNAPVRFQSTIVKAADADACRALIDPLVDGGGNVRSPGSGCPGADGDAGLRAFADNGGPVLTRAPSPGGLAIDRNPLACPATDARGFARPFAAACDAGAYELAAPAAATGAATGSTVTGSFNLRGPAGTARFQYGTSTAYGSATAPVAYGTGFGDRSLSAALTGLPKGKAIHYRLVVTSADGTATGADRTLPRDLTAPRLRSLKVSPKKFKVGKKVAISFTSSEAGKAKLAFHRILPGKKVKQKAKRGKKAKTKCVATRRKVKRRSRCKAYRSAGSTGPRAKSGKNKIAFRGKVGKKKLARGKYRLTLTVTDAAGNKSKGVTAGFTVKRR